ncbi:MAG TPA: gamma carbonic anhydrase family protein [Mycobacteriales bacterium]|jgi:carbonic anhydrase/acetyltransferase-like protein (isoleucine patch superfamily)|nr:gamma carbonic anhydrase family protein [Mycobacteriales bacterium]
MPVYALDDLVPQISPTAFVHPDAVLIGAVVIGDEASVWPGAVLRADYGRILVGDRTSIQDGTVLHTTEKWHTTVGADCVVGHNAHLEGCVIGDRCLVGSGSVVLNRAQVGAGSLVGASALVPQDFEVPPAHMALGVPVKVRPLDAAAHDERIEYAVGMYRKNAARYRSGLRRL